MFTLEELIELKNGMDSRMKALETTLSHCRTSKTINVINNKLLKSDLLIEKIDKLMKERMKS